ncbi:MAG: hypothetical protein WCG20_02520 [bacterium]
MKPSTLSDYFAQASFEQQQAVREPFSSDFLSELAVIGVRSTVEQMLQRLLTSAELLFKTTTGLVTINEQYALQIHVQGKVTRVEFFSHALVIATAIQEKDVIWELPGRIPKKVTHMRYSWPGWSPANGSLGEQYSAMLQKIGAYEKAYKKALV